ncbi:uncharacterized protein LOC131935458 [Physella acuta]|uniref:uncharacterized protein LOC131935458 n=1 Tax=Physella acuta TaxID=109671 RepID=UPI0027DC7742|nr:uncharacterized protein LOC131935458 [Physella acuta]
MGQVFVDAVHTLNSEYDKISLQMVLNKIGVSSLGAYISPKENTLKRDPAVVTVVNMGFPIDDALLKAAEIKEEGSVISADTLIDKLENDEPLRIIMEHSETRETNSTNISELLEKTRVVKEQNNQLRQQTVCKICMDKEVAVVFLPCGHLSSCADCASAMRDCPVCRVNVRGIVRAFMVFAYTTKMEHEDTPRRLLPTSTRGRSRSSSASSSRGRGGSGRFDKFKSEMVSLTRSAKRSPPSSPEYSCAQALKYRRTERQESSHSTKSKPRFKTARSTDDRYVESTISVRVASLSSRDKVFPKSTSEKHTSSKRDSRKTSPRSVVLKISPPSSYDSTTPVSRREVVNSDDSPQRMVVKTSRNQHPSPDARGTHSLSRRSSGSSVSSSSRSLRGQGERSPRRSSSSSCGCGEDSPPTSVNGQSRSRSSNEKSSNRYSGYYSRTGKSTESYEPRNEYGDCCEDTPKREGFKSLPTSAHSYGSGHGSSYRGDKKPVFEVKDLRNKIRSGSSSSTRTPQPNYTSKSTVTPQPTYTPDTHFILNTPKSLPLTFNNKPPRNSYRRSESFSQLSQPKKQWSRDLVARSQTYSHKFIDSHCHIDFIYKQMGLDRGTSFPSFKAMVSASMPANYEGCVAVFCDPNTFDDQYPRDTVLKSVAGTEGIWFAFGCHPKSATGFTDSHLKGLKKVLKRPKVVALGEIGLDYSGTFHRHADVQKRVLRVQLQLALDLDLPLVIHCRDADDDCLEIMQEMVPQDHSIHLHCFTRDEKTARRWLTSFTNLYIGLTPVITYQSAVEPMTVAARIPLNRLLLETDAPYFVPGAIRSKLKVSHPGLALYTAERIAELRNVSVDTVLKACRQNTRLVYGI